MTTRIKVQLTPEGVQEAIDRLEAWKVGTLKAATSMYALLVVDDVKETMASAAHASDGKKDTDYTGGRLKETIFNAVPVRVSGGSDVYRLTIDPVDPYDDGRHYAEEEMTRPGKKQGTVHDFTHQNALYVEKGAEDLWNESIKESL